MGMPFAWPTIAQWMDPKRNIFFPAKKLHKPAEKKCPDIPVLPSYRLPPQREFWRHFPSSHLPKNLSSLVNFRRLHEIVKENEKVLSLDQRIRAGRVLHDLEHGSVVLFTRILPPLRAPNTFSVVQHGEEFTDVGGSDADMLPVRSRRPPSRIFAQTQ
jgi:hypothetical protein